MCLQLRSRALGLSGDALHSCKNIRPLFFFDSLMCLVHSSKNSGGFGGSSIISWCLTRKQRHFPWRRYDFGYVWSGNIVMFCGFDVTSLWQGRRRWHLLWFSVVFVESTVIFEIVMWFRHVCLKFCESLELSQKPRCVCQTNYQKHRTAPERAKDHLLFCNYEAEPWVCLERRSIVANNWSSVFWG